MGEGTLTVFCGPMFGSKTTRLLSTIDRFSYQNKLTAAFKPKIDNRYSPKEISTHSGLRYPAIPVADINELKKELDIFKATMGSVDVVAVDELFMITGAAEFLLELWKDGIHIIVSSLDLSAKIEPFDELQRILPFATHIEKCPAVCVVCQKDAYYTEKHTQGGENIEVGGADLYSPRCRDHHSYFKILRK